MESGVAKTQFLKLFRKNKRRCERATNQAHQQDNERVRHKRKIENDEEYDKGTSMISPSTVATETTTMAPRPMSLVLYEMKRKHDPRLVYSDLISHGRHELTLKQQKAWHSVESETYLRTRSTCSLLQWQEDALNFIEAREADLAGIGSRGLMLCLDMGLGKTIISLAYQLYDNQRCFRQTGNRYNGCTLIAVQNKLLIDNWISEAHSKWPPGTFRYHILRSGKNRPLDRAYIENCCDFVLVTYATIKAAFRHGQKQEEEEEEETDDSPVDSDEDDLLNYDTQEEEEEGEEEQPERKVNRARTGRDYLYNVLFKTRWKRIIPDESHYFVNENTQLFKAMNALIAYIKWVVTGTPIQNSLRDICTSFKFIMVRLNVRLAYLGKEIEVSEEDREEVKAILDVVMIRMLKCDLNHLDSQMAMMPVVKTVRLIEFESLQEKAIYYLYATYGSHNRHLPRDKTRKRTNIAAILQLMMQLCIGIRIVDGLVLPGGMLTLGHHDELMLKPASSSECLFPSPPSRKKQETLEDFAAITTVKKTLFTHKSKNKGDHFLNLPPGYEMIYRANLEAEPVTHLDAHNEETFCWEPFKSDPLFDISQEGSSDRLLYRQIYERLCREGAQSARDIIKGGCVKTAAMVRHLMNRVLRVPHYSSKNRHILNHIVREVPAEDKVIVFTNSIRSMECLARDLAKHNVTTIIVNGTTCDNNGRIAQFKEEDSPIKVLILSFKLGNVGLNITCANHVIFMHPWWNPNMIEQAEKRVDRLGQRKIVYITHFIMNHTIDLYVLNLSHNKKSMTSSIIGAEDNKVNQIEQYAYSLYEYSFSQD